jgi:hypothetical protein
MFSIPGVPPGFIQDMSRLRRKYEAERMAQLKSIRDNLKQVAQEERARFVPKKQETEIVDLD